MKTRFETSYFLKALELFEKRLDKLQKALELFRKRIVKSIKTYRY